MSATPLQYSTNTDSRAVVLTYGRKGAMHALLRGVSVVNTFISSSVCVSNSCSLSAPAYRNGMLVA